MLLPRCGVERNMIDETDLMIFLYSESICPSRHAFFTISPPIEWAMNIMGFCSHVKLFFLVYTSMSFLVRTSPIPKYFSPCSDSYDAYLRLYSKSLESSENSIKFLVPGPLKVPSYPNVEMRASLISVSNGSKLSGQKLSGLLPLDHVLLLPPPRPCTKIISTLCSPGGI